MKLNPAFLLTGLLCLSLTFLPENAAQARSPEGEAANFKSPPTDAASLDSHGYLSRTAMLPVRTLGLGAALAIGTPIAIVRSEVASFGDYTRAVDTEMRAKDGSLGLILVSMPGEAMQIVEKAGTGLVNGGYNALQGWDRPFSEKSFSLN